MRNKRLEDRSGSATASHMLTVMVRYQPEAIERAMAM